jgi:hypothetical protein
MPSDSTPDPIRKLGPWDRPVEMPDDLAATVAGWPAVTRSPCGGGFYSQAGQPWQAPSDGCLRAADRWNLTAEDAATRFPTDRPLPPRTSWALARWSVGPKGAGVWVLLSAGSVEPRLVRDRYRDRAERLVATRRWTHSDLEVIEALAGAEALDRRALLAADPAGRERSLKSLLALRLAWQATTADAADPELPEGPSRLLREGADAALWFDADGRAIAAEVLAWHAKRQTRTEVRQNRRTEERERGDELKRSIAAAVRTVFPAMPAEVAASAATRLAPAVAKLGRRPGTQAIVDAVVDIRLERWRQAITADPEVEARLLAMQARGANGRVRKRFRDQRAIERVEAEIRDWRGELDPVTSPRLG